MPKQFTPTPVRGRSTTMFTPFFHTLIRSIDEASSSLSVMVE